MKRTQLTPEMKRSVDRLAIKDHRDDSIKLQHTAKDVAKIGAKGIVLIFATIVRGINTKIKRTGGDDE